MDTVVMILDLVHVQIFHYQILAGVCASQWAHRIELTSIRRRYYVDTWKSKFRRISKPFGRTVFDIISLIEKSMSFLHTFFAVISLVEKSTLFPHTFLT